MLYSTSLTRRQWLTRTAATAATAVLPRMLRGAKPAPPPPPVQYRFVSLGTLGGAYSTPNGMNAYGDVVGGTETAGGEYRPFLFLHAGDGAGTMVDLSQLIDPAGLDPERLMVDTRPSVFAINNVGQITGFTRLSRLPDDPPDSPEPLVAFRFTLPGPGEQFGAMTELFRTGDPNLAPRFSGINDFGDCSGAHLGSGTEAYLYTDQNGFEQLPMRLGRLINNNRQVAGQTDTGRMARYDIATGIVDDLGAPGGGGNGSAIGHGINIHGDVAGFGSRDLFGGNAHALRYTEATGNLKDLGTLGGYVSRGYGINSMGDVVGISWVKKNDPTRRPFLYSDRFGMIDLTKVTSGLPPGGADNFADGGLINDDGIIMQAVGGVACLLLPV